MKRSFRSLCIFCGLCLTLAATGVAGQAPTAAPGGCPESHAEVLGIFHGAIDPIHCKNVTSASNFNNLQNYSIKCF